MPTLVDLAFEDGDLVPIEVAPGIYDLKIVCDNAALSQTLGLFLNTHLGHNQYCPDVGWNLFGNLKNDAGRTRILGVCKEIKSLAETLDYVVSAKCEYQGYNLLDSQYEHIFKVSCETYFGPVMLAYALGDPAQAGSSTSSAMMGDGDTYMTGDGSTVMVGS